MTNWTDYYIAAAHESISDNDLWFRYLSKAFSENNLKLSESQISQIKSKGSLLTDNDIENLLTSEQLTKFQKSSLSLAIDKTTDTSGYIIGLLNKSKPRNLDQILSQEHPSNIKKRLAIREIEINIENLPIFEYSNSILQALYAPRFVISGRNAIAHYNLCSFDPNVEFLEYDKLADSDLNLDHIIYVQESVTNDIIMAKNGVRYTSLNKAIVDYFNNAYDDSAIDEIFDSMSDEQFKSFEQYLEIKRITSFDNGDIRINRIINEAMRNRRNNSN
ncbi:hypothetical protein LMK04_08050 [Lactococcus petauri]|uniref:hypothetical protein n=1 Tax=Lactococcus lactis TaxID=1358 RepID=UPI0020785D4B|nr:hypothetical protein [Lactococcus lactis]MDG4989855.1 hypothetical protein [Lactococcus lactis]USI67435.1 hypothetical protein LMK04_08050 [Lactococcus petauri]